MAEPFEGSGLYPTAEPSLAEPFLGFVLEAVMVSYRTLKVPNFFTKPFFAVRNLKKDLQERVQRSDKAQNLQKVLPNFLSFFWNFRLI